METSSRDKLELLNVAIQTRLDNRRNGLPVEEDDRNLLSQVLSQVKTANKLVCNLFRIKPRGPQQVESLRGKASVGSLGSPSADEVSSVADDVKDGDAPPTGVTDDAIVKELRHMKRQNTITHRLLSIMIIVTVAWQLSKVSVILKVRQNLNNPFRSVGNLVTGFFKGKGPDAADGNADKDKSHPAKQDNNRILLVIPPIKIPELPLIDITKFP